MPAKPLPVWTAAQLEEQRQASREAFKKNRVEEPVEDYTDQFELAWQQVAEVLERTVDLSDLEHGIEDIIKDPLKRRALRYMTGPPISDADLELLTDAKFSATYLAANPQAAAAITDTIMLLLDRKRFPWSGEARYPEAAEREVAVLATAAQVAAQATQAIRRNKARGLEEEVAEALLGAGYTKVAKRSVSSAADWPAPGQFCGEGKVAERQADLIVTLKDGRYLPIECKVSASELNSIKRLNNDSIGKFSTWTKFFGDGQTLPVAVLEGAYSIARLQAAQGAGAGIFWRHDLAQLVKFVS